MTAYEAFLRANISLLELNIHFWKFELTFYDTREIQK